MFIGRKEEGSRLTNCLHETLNGKGQVILISGEAGIGKTTLIEHWWESVSQDFGKNLNWASPVFARSSCSIPVGGMNVGELEALQPFYDILYSAAKPGRIKSSKKVSDILLESAPDWFNAIPVLGPIASAGIKTYNIYRKSKKSTEQNTRAASNQQQIFQQYVNFLNNLADNVSSVVIWIDDLHWADKSSLNLLFYIARQIQLKPILIIGTYRGEEIISPDSETHSLIKIRNEILRYDLGKVLELGYFTGKEISLLLKGLLKNYSEDAAFEKWLLKISSGNALFISQYLKTLSEYKFIDEDGKISANYKSITEPETVHAVIEERMRRLDDTLLETLRYATAEGEEFTSQIVSKLTGKGTLELLRELKKAEELGIIKNTGTKEIYSGEKTTVYTFIHSLYYNSLYDSLNDEEKNILHQRCFDVLKPVWDNNRDNTLLSTKILAHAEKCGYYYDASGIALICGKKYWSIYSLTEAKELFKKVLNYGKLLKENLPEKYNINFRKEILSEAAFYHADTTSRIGYFDEALEGYKESAIIFEELGNLNGIADAKNGVSYILGRKTRYNESIIEAEKVLEIANKINYDYAKASALGNIAAAKAGLGDFDSAIENYNKSAKIAREMGYKAVEAHNLYLIGSMLFNTRKFKESQKYLEDAIKISHECSYRNGEASAIAVLALIKAEEEKFEEAKELLMKSLSVYHETGDRYAQAWVLNKFGIIELNKENLDIAMDLLNQSLEIYKELNSLETIAGTLLYIGRIYLLKNDVDKCESTLNECGELLKK